MHVCTGNDSVDPGWGNCSGLPNTIVALFPNPTAIEKELLALAFASVNNATFIDMKEEKIVALLKEQVEGMKEKYRQGDEKVTLATINTVAIASVIVQSRKKPPPA